MLLTALYSTLVAILVLAGFLSCFYLLVLFLAAALGRVRVPREFEADEARPQIAVVIPSHNEELVLAATLAAWRKQDYPANRFELVVIADNCSDTTADIARSARVTVLERQNREERGKGYALAWAFDRLLFRSEVDSQPLPDACVIVDADTVASPDFLSRVAARFRDGEHAIQGRYGVLNARESWRAALMSGAFDLVNHIRLLGADHLGLFIGLKGNGMLFSRDVLLKARWSGHSITEDLDYSLDLVAMHGIAVRYAPEARVVAQMPTTAKQAASQRARWEEGRYRVIRERFGSVLATGLRQHDKRLIDAALGFLVPPLSELVALLTLGSMAVALGASLGWLVWPALWIGLIGASWLALLVYILGGLAVSGASAGVYAALLKAPFYALWKFALYIGSLFGRGNGKKTSSEAGPEWVRTERAPIAPADTGVVVAAATRSVGSREHSLKEVDE